MAPPRRLREPEHKAGSEGFQLSPTDVERFDRDGYLAPIDVFDPDEVAALRAEFEEFEARHGPEGAIAMRTDLHLLHRWVWDAVTNPRVVGPLVSVLGPDVLLWSLNWFIKEARDGKYVSLHQDANYWGLEPHEVVTAWIALSDASPPTGPMQFLPGTHRGELHRHENTYAADNLLSRGQRVDAELDISAAQLAPLAAGQMSLHHVRLVHGSGPNETDDRRIGMVLRFCATSVRQTKGHDSAVLVAGTDRFGNFELLPGPTEDAGPTESARHLASVRRMSEIIHSD